ncbi:MAG: ribonuclease P protein component [Limisphaerales bacterium]
MKRLRLGRALRVEQSRDFARIRQQGERLANGCLIANCIGCPMARNRNWALSRVKKIGDAPDRSRARRLLRESFGNISMNWRNPLNSSSSHGIRLPGKNLPTWKRIFWRRCSAPVY